MTARLRVGQKVRYSFNRWTPDGFVPVVEIATVVDPCVENDPDYAGDVEIHTEGTLNREFAKRDDLEPIEDGPITPGRYLRLCRERSGHSIADIAAMVHTEPRTAEHLRADWIEKIEADEMPASFATIVALRQAYDFDMDVLAHLVAISMGAPYPPPQICRDCGCTEDHACDEGCYWVEPDLCSSCADPQFPSSGTATGEAA